MLEDIRFAIRTMAENRWVTAAAILTLALGIGANTAIFSVVNAVLLRPLPYRDAGRLVTIPAQIPSMKIAGAHVEYNTYAEWWRAQAKSFESWVASIPTHVNLTSGGEPERLRARRVTAGFLSLVGLRPALGRDFLADEDRPGGTRAAMLSPGLWKRRFGSDPGVLGRTVVLDGNSHTIVGVIPPEFDLFGDDAEIYTPIAAPTARAPGMPTVAVAARLRPGVSVAAAQAEIDGLCRRWVQTYPYPRDWGARVWPVRDYFVREVRTSIVVLAVSVALVLLIACANVANLMLARAGARQREIAIRSTLGASPFRILRQLLTESSVLAACGASLGILAAWAGVRWLSSASPYVPFQAGVRIDGRVLLFTLAATLMTTILFGLAPALAAARTNLSESLKEGGRAGDSVERSRFRSILVVAEVALALIVTMGATVTALSLMRLEGVDPGFRPAGVLVAEINLPPESYPKPVQRANFFRLLRSRLESIPGVNSAGMVSHLPFGGSKSGSDIVVEGAPPPPPGERNIVFGRRADPNYFRVIGTPLVRGRVFTEQDAEGPPVAVINETMAKRFWPGQDAVGKRFGHGRNQWLTVIGVVADMHQSSLSDEPDPEWYVPHVQLPDGAMAVVARTPMDPLSLAPALRDAVWSLDRNLPVSKVGTLASKVAGSTRARRFSVVLLGSFAVLALVLAAVGIYGVISYSVTRRTHEIGIRMALGAERSRISGMVVVRALILAGSGAAVGICGGLVLARFIRSMLFGVSASDPLLYAAITVVVLCVSALAAWIPARRAARIDPVVALRFE